MTIRLGTAIVLLLLVAGCGSSDSFTAALEQTRATTYANVARKLYDEERFGSPAMDAVRLISALPALRRAVRRGDAAAAVRALHRQPVRHAVRARLVVGSRVFADVGLRFVVGGPVHAYKGFAKGSSGAIEVSIQDVIGYVRLMRRLTGVQMLVRGQDGHFATLLPGAAASALPVSGSASISGKRYLVSSFARPGFAGEQLTVWVLVPA